MIAPPRDNNAFRFPVSVKGVVVRDDAVVLLHNARNEWELPGGKLELGESPEECVVVARRRDHWTRFVPVMRRVGAPGGCGG